MPNMMSLSYTVQKLQQRLKMTIDIQTDKQVINNMPLDKWSGIRILQSSAFSTFVQPIK